MGKFVNADKILCANRDIISCNLFAYVSNRLLNYSDHSGNGFMEFAQIFGETIQKFVPAYAGGAGVAVADGPLPFGDIIAAVGAIGLTLGIGIYSIEKSLTKDETKENCLTKPKDKETSPKVYFPEDNRMEIPRS